MRVLLLSTLFIWFICVWFVLARAVVLTKPQSGLAARFPPTTFLSVRPLLSVLLLLLLGGGFMVAALVLTSKQSWCVQFTSLHCCSVRALRWADRLFVLNCNVDFQVFAGVRAFREQLVAQRSCVLLRVHLSLAHDAPRDGRLRAHSSLICPVQAPRFHQPYAHRSVLHSTAF